MVYTNKVILLAIISLLIFYLYISKIQTKESNKELFAFFNKFYKKQTNKD